MLDFTTMNAFPGQKSHRDKLMHTYDSKRALLVGLHLTFAACLLGIFAEEATLRRQAT